MELLNKVIGKILIILKSPKLLVGIALSAALILYLPTSHSRDIAGEFGKWIYIIFIASLTMLSIEGITYLYKKWQDRSVSRHVSEAIANRLAVLTEQEKAILREFHLQDQNLIKMPINNVNVVSLTQDGIILLMQQMPEFHHGHRLGLYSLSRYTAELLTDEILGFPEEGPTSENIERIERMRPMFAVEIQHKDKLWNS
jgi:hypothetical protein